MVKKVIIYGRVSTQDQAKDETIESQIEPVKKEIERRGNREIIEIVKDEGVSGKLMPEKRSGLSRIIEMAKEKKFKELWIRSRDRLSRDVVISGYIRGVLTNQHEINIISLDDTDNKFVNQVNDIVGEMEYDKYKEKREAGIQRAIDDQRAISNPPFGYKLVYEGRHRKIVVDNDPDKIALIIQIYKERYVNKRSIQMISKMYQVSRYIVGKIISDPIYIDGTVTYGKKPIYYVEPIISDKIKNEIKELIEENKDDSLNESNKSKEE